MERYGNFNCCIHGHKLCPNLQCKTFFLSKYHSHEYVYKPKATGVLILIWNSFFFFTSNFLVHNWKVNSFKIMSWDQQQFISLKLCTLQFWTIKKWWKIKPLKTVQLPPIHFVRLIFSWMTEIYTKIYLTLLLPLG